MIRHVVRVHRSAEHLPRSDQLAWKLAAAALDPAPIDRDVAEMIGNRVIDNAAVAIAALARRPVAVARAQALAHPAAPGATVIGTSAACSPEWAAWANSVAVRELDFHDTFLAADYGHPADNIPPLLAVAQHTGQNGATVLRAIAAAYEIHVALVKGICLHRHKIDHVAHLGPAVAAGLGALLGLDTSVCHQAIQQALHVTTATRQSRKGAISSWKAFAPAFAGKAAIEAVDRAMRGEGAPEPIYEGEDGVIAWLLDGPDAAYEIELPEPGSPKRAILATYTKEYAAEYQCQALIDLARRMRNRISDPAAIRDIVIATSHHTHFVIGTGSGDPEKYDPGASRETLDHSLPYVFAVALEDGAWHHEKSYLPTRAQRPSTVALWRKIRTVESAAWTSRYHAADPAQRAFGGEVTVTMNDGTRVVDAQAVADAHPAGARPFARRDYVQKFRNLADGIVVRDVQDRFLDLVARLPDLTAAEIRTLNPVALAEALGPPTPAGLFG